MPRHNFFELGGDSLMTMMVIFRINDVLNIDLPPGAIMEAPTLWEFCKKVDEEITASESEILAEGEDFDTQELESGVI